MLFRRDNERIIAIPQPSHAWLSGQLARAWGNESFIRPAPYEEVCLGAEQHDIAWLSWEAMPTLNPATSLPHEFREIDIKTRVSLWTEGIKAALAFGLYPALLVSLHAYTIHATFAPTKKLSVKSPQGEADRLSMLHFLDRQQAFRQQLLMSLAGQPRYRDFTTREITERNRLLIYAVDRMSLEICWGVRGVAVIPGVSPDGRSSIDLRLCSRNGEPDDLIVEPWPFAKDACHLVCEGCRLKGPFEDETAMRYELADPQARVGIEVTLRPG